MVIRDCLNGHDPVVPAKAESSSLYPDLDSRFRGNDTRGSHILQGMLAEDDASEEPLPAVSIAVTIVPDLPQRDSNFLVAGLHVNQVSGRLPFQAGKQIAHRGIGITQHLDKTFNSLNWQSHIDLVSRVVDLNV